MKILFCNIAYQRFYDGRIAGEIKPETGGRWVKENEDAHEKWNFLNMDGNCYGYVQAGGEEIHIEKLDKVYRQQDSAEDVTIIWCACHPDRGTVIVGWYEHATVHRYWHLLPVTPVSGIDRAYWFSTKAEDAYLLPEEDRTFTIGRASKLGAGKGFGQSNVWFAESEYAKNKIIPDAIAFLEGKKSHRINTMTDIFDMPEELSPLSEEELQLSEKLANESEREYLPFAYRIYANDQNGDNAFVLGRTLAKCHQYKMATTWYEKAFELNPDDMECCGVLAYMYQHIGEYEKSIKTAEYFLDRESDQELKSEVYGILADDYYMSGDKTTAVYWLDRIISESNNEELVAYTKENRKEWLNV